TLFSPRSVAVVGASATVGKVGYGVLKNLIDMEFEGRIYPVNPKHDSILDLLCYQSISDTPETPDLVIITVPAALVPDILAQAGNRGVPAAIVISAGFREVGEAGQMLETKIVEIAKKYNIALIGPNCLGVINPAHQLNASFASVAPSVGAAAFISQSGALCTAVLDYAKELGIGFSKFVSVGNKACIGEIELVDYLTHDTQTKVILMYEEDITRADDFIRVVSKLTSHPHATPVVSLKAGRTQAGVQASASHTGALGGNDALIDAVFRKSGIIRAYSIEELFDYATVFSTNPLPEGNRVAIITNAGGPGVIAADSCSEYGLKLAKLTAQEAEKLGAYLPPHASVGNPIDVLGDAPAERYRQAIEIVLESAGVDMLVVILTPQTTTEIEQTARVIIEAKQKYDKPIIVCFMGAQTVAPGVSALRSASVATTMFPEDAVRAGAGLAQFSLRLKEPFSKPVRPENINEDEAARIIKKLSGLHPTENDARSLLRSYGFKTLTSEMVTSGSAAAEYASRQTSPVAMKIVSPDILHKSDIGGVMLDVEPNKIEASYETICSRVQKNLPHAKIEGVLATPMAPRGGFEIILGAKRDLHLGVSVVMVGIGGIYVEVYHDIAFDTVPVTQHSIEGLIARTKLEPVLAGVRGMPALGRASLITDIARVSCLMEYHPEVLELDINPYLLYPKGGIVLDARLKLHDA
ncbi:MAG: acetate--CoA ligase family protein, partial [Caldilineaceae bacterium]|nr:acetate--CoA ligase family protein [Caldilineaceae bacterium]